MYRTRAGKRAAGRKAGAVPSVARMRAERDSHTAVLELHAQRGAVPEVHVNWHYDLRRKRLCIYGGLLRFLDVCVEDGRPDLAWQVVTVLANYVEDIAGPRDPAAAMRVAA